MITYAIKPENPQAHLFQVKIVIDSPAADGQRLMLPAWIPGSYMIRNFARNIVWLKATCNGKEIHLQKLDKQTWQCAPCTGQLQLDYQVYAWDLSVRSAHLDSTHGYFNGTSVFLKVIGQENEPCQVEIQPPEGEAFAGWRVATTLQNETASEFSFGLYGAVDYFDLIDHPVEMGDFTVATFNVAETPHHLVITGRFRADVDRICKDLKAICSAHIDLFGELPQMKKYIFLVHAVGDGYGGLEHRDSTSLICKRSDFPIVGESEVSEGYRQFLGLCSHEYFHLWNVKRITPAAFLDADLSSEVHTRLLWAFEGITSYYDDLALVRSGRIEVDSYLELLARLITRVIRGSGRFYQSLAESSFDAWTKFYLQDENAANAIVSYYSKGALVALALDLTIRIHTDGQKSLDDLMRELWTKFGKDERGVGENDVELLASEIAGFDLQPFFSRYIHGTEDPPLLQLLAKAGIAGHFRPAEDSADKGGLRRTEGARENQRSTIGIQLQEHNTGAKISAVMQDSAAMSAGLSAGDVIIALDQIKVTKNNFDSLLQRIPVGESIVIHSFRDDLLMQFSLQPVPAPDDTCDLWLKTEADDSEKSFRKAWLN